MQFVRLALSSLLVASLLLAALHPIAHAAPPDVAAQSSSATGEVGEPAPAPPASEPPASPGRDGLDLERARRLLDEAQAAREASDYPTARTKTAEAVELLLAAPDDEENDVWLELVNTAGRSARDAEDGRTARAALRRVLEVRSRTLPEDHPDLQKARLNLASTISRLGDLHGARVLEERVLEVFARTLPDDHPDLQVARLNLATTIRALGDLPGARALQAKALEVCLQTLPEDHLHLQMARQNLALTIKALGDLPGARALEVQVLKVRTRTLPEDHPSLQRARLNLAVTIKTLGDLQGARALLERVLEVYSRTLPEDHPDLQAARLNLAATISTLGDFQGARALSERALEVYSRTLPEDHPNLQAARLSLAVTMLQLGDPTGARVLEERVLEVYSRTLPEDHPDLQMARQNLAATILTLGDLQGARALLERVLEVYSRTLPEDHPDLQRARLNLAAAISNLGDLHGARVFEEQALEVYSRTLPEEHPELQLARLSMAATINRLGDVHGARRLEEKVLEVYSRTLPEDHPDLQLARQNLAGTIGQLGDVAGAHALFEGVLDVRSRTLPEDHPDLQMARMNLAVSIAATEARATGMRERQGEGYRETEGRRERCLALVGSLCRANSSAARAAQATSSTREAEERCAQLARGLDPGLSFAAGCGVFDPSPALDVASFELGETTRGAALAAARNARLAASSASYRELRRQLRAAADELAALAQSGTTGEPLRAALARREGIERDLASMAADSSGGKGLVAALDVEQLAAALAEGAVAVGFHRYARWAFAASEKLEATGQSFIGESAVPSLCALVLCPGAAQEDGSRGPAQLVRVELGAIEPIEAAVRAWREAAGAGLERGVGALAALADSERARGAALRVLILDPLFAVVGDARHMIVALDDVLHSVPLDALPLDTGESARRVADRWRIETRATLTELLAPPPAASGSEVLVSLGGASFNSSAIGPGVEDVAVMEAVAPRGGQVAPILRGSAWERGFGPLTYTGLEARGVAALHEEVFEGGGASIVLEKRRASRESLREFAPRARWLHVATHGWFAPESIPSWGDPEPLDWHSGMGMRLSGVDQVRGMSPMLLCGLAFAGANLPQDALGRAPGLVTADELATLDLTNCELAVLSACDTNVGERRAGQGVASLQKALQMAGARSVITSLWKVPDEATKELMLDFYRRLWVEKKPKWQALSEAKKRLRNAKDERGEPRYIVRDWAAWVLTGEPE